MKKRPQNLFPSFFVVGSALFVVGLMFVNLGAETHSIAMTGGAAAASAFLYQLAGLFGDL
jgi:hypothetical protein